MLTIIIDSNIKLYFRCALLFYFPSYDYINTLLTNPLES